MSQEQQTDFTKLLKELESTLKSSRDNWNNIISSLTEKLKNETKDMILLQAETINYRQMLAEEVSIYAYKILKDMTKIKKMKKDLFEYYSTKYQIKISSNTKKDELIEADMAVYQEKVNYLEAHINFLKDTIKNADNINYAVKNKINILNILGLS